MSVAATDPLVHHRASDHVATRSTERVIEDNLPVPRHEPIASFIAFLFAGPGAMAMATLLCVGLINMARGGSTTLWSLGIATAFTVWFPTFLIALYVANARDEWGR